MQECWFQMPNPILPSFLHSFIHSLINYTHHLGACWMPSPCWVLETQEEWHMVPGPQEILAEPCLPTVALFKTE